MKKIPDPGKFSVSPLYKRASVKLMHMSDTPEKDVPVNACVVHDKKTDKFFVFMTTDTTKTARQIIQIYEFIWTAPRNRRRLPPDERFLEIKQF